MCLEAAFIYFFNFLGQSLTVDSVSPGCIRWSRCGFLLLISTGRLVPCLYAVAFFCPLNFKLVLVFMEVSLFMFFAHEYASFANY